MRNLIIMAALVLLSTACEKDQGYYLSGSIDGVDDGTNVFISEISEETKRPEIVDTLKVKEGKFEADLPENDRPKMAFLSIEGVNGNIIYIAENEKVKIEAYKDSLRSSKVTGGKENHALSQYMTHLKETNKKVMDGRNEMREAYSAGDTAKLESLQAAENEIRDNDSVTKKKLFEENKDSYVSLMILMDMLRMKAYPVKEIKDMYSEIPEELKNTPIGKDLKETLDKQDAVAVGSKAPNFTAPTPSGEKLALKDAMGEVTIVDFWASWCKPCRAENPNVVKIYDKYHDQGLNIVGVSLDRPGEKDKWIEAIGQDGLEWQHVSNLKFWQDPIAQMYSIEGIPATFILDKNGQIVARNLRGDDLEAKINELLN